MTIMVDVHQVWVHDIGGYMYAPIVSIQAMASEKLNPVKLMDLQRKLEEVINENIADCRMKEANDGK